ncbi:hypothetical protein GCM10010413_37570 [Promicromonospora sukumoe]|uniref:AcrR family transcriptional regulator n=1 Tax=Promicromonospora sukumoe TaxID=88382 RepID=A0A7W3J7K8_9MICO|nr:TetR/AcrR family transcriptional regulator [Promicromonospora sukumoe]MBA8807695.1 AcrR family transcriptional regulator [Promicromonospora sukumoe]
MTPPDGGSTTPAVTRPVGHHHGDLRNALEAAALDLLAERGPSGFTLNEVSRRAGVSKAAPYKHFADKDDLLASLVQRCYERQHSAFSTAVAEAATPTDALVAFAAAYVRFAAEEPALFTLTFGGTLDKAAHPRLEEAGNRVLDVITAPAQDLAQDADDAHRLVLAIAANAHGFAVFHLQGVIARLDLAVGQAERCASLLTQA